MQFRPGLVQPRLLDRDPATRTVVLFRLIAADEAGHRLLVVKPVAAAGAGEGHRACSPSPPQGGCGSGQIRITVDMEGSLVRPMQAAKAAP